MRGLVGLTPPAVPGLTSAFGLKHTTGDYPPIILRDLDYGSSTIAIGTAHT